MGNISARQRNRFQYDFWLEQSQALNDDGVITYKAPRNSGYTKVFRQLERRLGLDFERVRRNPEIRCRYEPLDSAGVTTTDWDGTFTVYTDPDYKGEHVEAHEIGHALGLAHVDRNRTAMATDWDYRGQLFTSWDLNNIRTVYDL